MHISAKVDYALRALLFLYTTEEESLPCAVLANNQKIPQKYLEAIMSSLKRGQIVASHRGNSGGYYLARPGNSISIADVIRAVDGPLAEINGHKPEDMDYFGSALHLKTVWIALRASMRSILETTTLSDVADGHLPQNVSDLAKNPDSWTRRN
jgi:Rrf2 family protein